MSRKNIIFLLLALTFLAIFAIALLFFYFQKIGQAKFEPSFKFGNQYLGREIEFYFITQKDFSWKTQEGSQNFCSAANLLPEKELFPLYVWVFCGEYAEIKGKLTRLSGVSAPAVVNYPNELSYYDFKKFSHRVPRDGSFYSEDVKEMFPEEVQEKIFNLNIQPIIKKNEYTASSLFGVESVEFLR